MYLRAGLLEDAAALADKALREFRERPVGSEREMRESAELFHELGRWDEFEKLVESMGMFPSRYLDEMRERFGTRRRRR